KRAALNAFHGVFISCSHASDTAPSADCPFTSCRVYGNSLGHTQTEQSRCYFDGHDHYYLQSVYSKGQEHDLLYDIPSMKRVGNIFLGNVSLNGDTMMATPNYHTAGSFRPGDVLFNSTHGWWYVESQGAGPDYTIACKPLTDAAYDGTTWRILDSTPFGGNFYYYPITTLDLTPSDIPSTTGLFMTTTAGSAVVNFVNGAGVAANRPARLTVNSKPLWYGKNATHVSCVGNGHAESLIPFPPFTNVASVAA